MNKLNAQAIATVVQSLATVNEVDVSEVIIALGETLTSTKPVSGLDLTTRSHNSLGAVGVRTVGELVKLTPAEILALPNAGKKTLTEIIETLGDFNLVLAPDVVKAQPVEVSIPSKVLPVSVRTAISKHMQIEGITAVELLSQTDEAFEKVLKGWKVQKAHRVPFITWLRNKNA